MNKLADILGDPKSLLTQFESAMLRLEIPTEQIEHAKRVINETTEKMAQPKDPSTPRTRSMEEVYPGFGDATNLAYDAYFKVGTGGAKLSDVGHKLFLSILQSLTLAPALRKKVEIASRVYMKNSKPRLKDHGNERYLEMFALYDKFMATVHSHLEVARKAIQDGKAHLSEGAGATKVRVGDFTLVNTGGFSEEIIGNVADVIQKAQSLAKSAGFGEVCYGEIQVTNTLSKPGVLAFYHLESDELFVRANVKPNIDTIQTVLHELGHRYQHKVLGSAKKRQVEQLYYVLSGQERSRDLGSRKPNAGDVLESKGKTYKVVTTVYERGAYKVLLTIEGKPGATASVPLEAYLDLKGEHARDLGPEFKGFVSNYAKKGGPAENFAEMFSYYCMGKLPKLQKPPFEEIVFGASKTAQRVASRWNHHITSFVGRK